jgi:hypothetical protein
MNMTTATDKLKEGKKLLSDFENMRYMAELKALSNVSLERPLTDAEYERFKWLARKQGLGDLLIKKYGRR